jgi:hypothetical protein
VTAFSAAVCQCLLSFVQKLKESNDMTGIKQASDAHHPGEIMDHPSVVHIVCQGLYQYIILLLLSGNLPLWADLEAAEVDQGYSLVLCGDKDPVLLPSPATTPNSKESGDTAAPLGMKDTGSWQLSIGSTTGWTKVEQTLHQVDMWLAPSRSMVTSVSTWWLQAFVCETLYS